ncbi:MAG: hypothetical protein AAGF32_02650 [Pseudomonadota bacterium]
MATLCVGVWMFVAGAFMGVALAGKTLQIAAPSELIATGVFAHLAPRFRFKTRLRLEVIPLDDMVGAKLADGTVGAAVVCADTGAREGLIRAAGPGAIASALFTWSSGAPVQCALVAPAAAQGSPTTKLAQWLTTGSGHRAVLKFKPTDQSTFSAPQETIEVAAAPAQSVDQGLLDLGEKLSLRHCGRCHVVSSKNRLGGIGSTPSFRALRTIPGGDDKFAAFWSYAPHIAFTQVDGITAPFPPERPSPIAPVELTLDDVEAITAFALSLQPADLGAPIKAQ